MLNDGRDPESRLPEEATAIAAAWREFGQCTSLATLAPCVFGAFLEACGAEQGYFMLAEGLDAPVELRGVHGLEEPAGQVRLRGAQLSGLRGLPIVAELRGALPPVAKEIIAHTDRAAGVSEQWSSAGVWVELVETHVVSGFVRLAYDAADRPGTLPALLEELAHAAASNLRRLAATDDSALHQLTEILAAAVDRASEAPPGHSVAVGDCCGMTAQLLDLPPARCELAEMAGHLHDFGKVFSAPELARTERRLTDEELHVVRERMLASYEVLRTWSPLRPVSRVLRHVYEAWDGSGYPDGLKGEQIPAESRIVRVVHRFYVGLQPRPYRQHLPGVVEAAELLRGRAGAEFDPQIVECFLHGFADLAGGDSA